MKRVFNVLFLSILVFGLVVAQRDPKPFIRTDKVTFVSKPPTTGQVGIAYSFTAKAVSSDSTARISYYPYQWIMTFVPVKNLFTVDSATGLFTFMPQFKGWYTFGVLARSSKGGFSTQIFSVTVTGGNGIVQGKITDTSTVGIKGVVVELFKTELTDSSGSRSNSDFLGGPSVYQNSGSYWFYGLTDASGNYRISGVDPGKYKIHATSPSRSYLSQWYEGKTNATEATLVDVKDTIITLVNFVLRGNAVIQPVMVSGSVTDTLNVPIKKAEVIFVNSNFALNSNTDVDDVRLFFDVNAGITDCKLDGHSPQVIHVKVDTANGTFNTSIPPGSYIAFAKATGYITEF
ncbi:MAG: carboxypeptidase regulatory-like domain-containing protein, partial [Ignavibacteriae bacterium]